MRRQSRLLTSLASLLLLVGMLAGISGCSRATTEQTTATDIKIAFVIEPDPPAIGQSMLRITLKDANGIPIDGATISVRGDMDHAGMQPAFAEGTKSINGEYRIPIEWSMGGGWIVTVRATLPDNRKAVEKFNLFVEAVSNHSVVKHGKATVTPVP